MKKILTIMIKELKMFFSNKRLVLSCFAPALFLFIFYFALSNLDMTDKTDYTKETFNVAIFNNDEYYSKLLLNGVETKIIEYDNIDNAKNDLSNEKISLIINYDENFKVKIDEGNIPNVAILYNSLSKKSIYIYNSVYQISAGLSITYETKYTVNKDVNSDISDGKGTSLQIMSIIIPLLFTSLLIMGGIGYTTSVIAGEKERGTMSTLLLTPVKRSTICFGKMVALSLISIFMSLISVASFAVSSLFKINGVSDTGETIAIDFSLYNFSSYVYMLIATIVTILLVTAVLSCISTVSKTVKEASTYSGIITMVFTALSMIISYGTGTFDSVFYLIPFFNSILIIKDIFSLTISVPNLLIMVGSNIVYIIILVYVCKKMFESEKIMTTQKI